MKITIKSDTEFYPSKHEGLCKLERNITSFSISIPSDIYGITVEDRLFKDDVDEKNNSIRRYIDRIEINRFTYKKEEIDAVFLAMGVDIVKPESFHEKLYENMQVILLAETLRSNWKGTTDYSVDPIIENVII